MLEIIRDGTSGPTSGTSRTTRLLTAPIAAALAVGLSATVPAHASGTTKKDPRNDVFLASVGGGIDLAAVRLQTLSRKKRIRVTFTLHSGVRRGGLEDPGGLSARFTRSKRAWRIVEVATKDGVLGSTVCSHSRGPDFVEPYDCSSLPVAQVDATTYRTVVELGQIKERAEVLRWTAWSMDLSNGDPVSDSLTAKDQKPFRWRL
jgi:hypothetical protein